MVDYIIVYYYSKKEKSWIAEVRDEENQGVESIKAFTEESIKEKARRLGKKYDALRISKTDPK
jgi:di/tripeptidase